MLKVRPVVAALAVGVSALAVDLGQTSAVASTSTAPAKSVTAGAPAATSNGEAAPSRYVIVLRGAPGTQRAAQARTALTDAQANGVKVDRVYSHALNGFAARLTA